MKRTGLVFDEANKPSNLFNPLTDVIVRKDAPERTDNAEDITIQRIQTIAII